jgi:hypothetical protein
MHGGGNSPFFIILPCLPFFSWFHFYQLMKLLAASTVSLALLCTCLLWAKNAQVSITVAGEQRLITSNGMPDHKTGSFPNRNNPNRISAQDYRYSLPVHPTIAATPTPLGMRNFGLAINGIPFDPNAAEWFDEARTWQYEAMGGAVNLGVDESHAHVQPTGAYHYHGLPTALIIKLTQGKPALVHLGWAADGFPIYGPWGHQQPADNTTALVKLRSSYQLKKGKRPAGAPDGDYDGSFVNDWEYVSGSGDLDECNGRFGPTPEFPQGTYHYYLTESFPFIPRFFKGTPDPSFERRGPPPGMGAKGKGKSKGKGKGPRRGEGEDRRMQFGDLFRPD